MSTPAFRVDAKVYITYSPYNIWSGKLCKVLDVYQSTHTGKYLYTIEFMHMGTPTVLKDYDEHKLRPFYD